MPRPAPSSRASVIDAPFRWIVENQRIVDAVSFGVPAALLLLGTLIAQPWPPSWATWSAPMIAAGMFLRSHTGWATLAIGVLAVAHFATGTPGVLGDVMIFYALYCATMHGSRRTRRFSLAAAFAGAAMQSALFAILVGIAQDWLLGTGLFFIYLAGGSAVVLGVWAVGRYQWVRGEQLRLVRERADQAIREREQRTALAVADERARIAREMHDVVAHSLSVIIAQADGGRYVAAHRPEQATDALETIGRSGRAALADMRGLLGVLRHDEETSFGPQPGIEMLDELVERVRSAGLSTELRRYGDLDAVPQALGLTVFRVVQEALTNVMKHAGPGVSASVDLAIVDQELHLDVSDDGRGDDPAAGAGAEGPGHGLTGMRERIGAFHGVLRAGSLPGGGYRVSARIPLPDDGRNPV